MMADGSEGVVLGEGGCEWLIIDPKGAVEICMRECISFLMLNGQ